MERKNHQDFLTALVVGGIGIAALIESGNISRVYMKRPQHGDILTSPSLTPMILGCALIFCALLLLIRSLRGKGIVPVLADVGAAFKGFLCSKLVHFTILGLIVMAFYIYVLLDMLPFALATLVFLIILMLMLKATKPWKIVLISMVAVVLITVLFQGIFHIRLP